MVKLRPFQTAFKLWYTRRSKKLIRSIKKSLKIKYPTILARFAYAKLCGVCYNAIKLWKGLSIKKRPSKKHFGRLNVTFSKRNVFFNVENALGITVLNTTLRRVGFRGRRRQEYTSLVTLTRIVKGKLKNLKLRRLILIYRG